MNQVASLPLYAQVAVIHLGESDSFCPGERDFSSRHEIKYYLFGQVWEVKLNN